MKKVVKSAFALLMVFYVLSTVNPVSASAALTADRSISGTICPGSTFTVTITLDVTGSPVKGLSITEDLSALPDGWTVAPNDGGIYNAGSKKLEYIWFDPSGSIGDETVTYDVTVSGDATVGASYDITGKTELTPPKTTVDIGTDTDTVTVIVCEDSLSVTVLYPNGGESIPIGTQVQVSAHATTDVKVTSVHFYYSSNGGSSWNPIGAGTIVSGTAKDGIWNRTWNTDGLSAGTNYMIKTVASDGTSTSEDQSESAFSLTPSKVIRVPDDYPTIQAAIDAASSGYIITVSSGTYFEHLVIDKPLKLIGEDKNTTIINGSGSGYCVHITADNVEICGFTIRNGSDGVLLETSDGCTISGNIIRDNYDGIRLTDSNSNAITNNILFNNVLYLSGIHLSSSNNNVISDNDLVENGGGVSLRDSNNNLIYHNNFVDNIFKQAYDNSGTNSWDKGSSVGGNYWSDHTCTGNPSDGSHPYSIVSNSIDHYPFQKQSGWVKDNQPAIPDSAGAISVTSSPPGATIELESFVGPTITTPYTVTDVPVGTHTIKLTLEGYQDWSTTVHVIAGTTSSVHATLAPMAVQPSTTPQPSTGKTNTGEDLSSIPAQSGMISATEQKVEEIGGTPSGGVTGIKLWVLYNGVWTKDNAALYAGDWTYLLLYNDHNQWISIYEVDPGGWKDWNPLGHQKAGYYYHQFDAEKVGGNRIYADGSSTGESNSVWIHVWPV